MQKSTWPSALLMSLILSLSLVGCSKPTAEEQLKKAKEYVAKGDRKAAIIEYKNLLADYPDNVAARQQLGLLYLETGEADAALIELKKAGEHGGDRVASASQLARALLAKGDPIKVLAFLDPKTMPEAASAPALLALRAQALAARGLLDEAVGQYQAALKIDPKFADATIGMARVSMMRRQPEAALGLLDALLSQSPQQVDALLLKGDIVRQRGDKDGARTVYEQALAADKNKDQAYLGLIGLAIESDQLPKAKEYLAQLQKMSPNNFYARHLEAFILWRENQPDQALTKALEVLKISPQFPAANLLAANIEYSKGLYQQAIAHLNSVLASVPNNLQAQRLMVATLLKQNEIDKAGELLAKLTEHNPEDPALLSLAGEIAARKRDYAGAMAAYSHAAKLNPSAELRTKAAMARMATGDAKAMQELENIASDDKSIQADIVLALAHINKREWPQAEAAVARLEKKQADHPLVGSLKASILLGKNDLAGARKQTELLLTQHPDYVPAAVSLARMDMQEKKPEQAQKRFEALLAKDSKNARMMLAYAEFLVAINKPQDAQNWLDKARQAQPEAVEPALALTSLALRNKDIKRATAVAQEALAKKPDNPVLLDNLAVVQIAAGDQNQALATLAKLVKAAPTSVAAYIKLANVQMNTGNTAGAIDSLQKAIAVAPASVDAHMMLGMVYLKGSQFDAALKMALAVQRLQPSLPDGFLLEGDLHLAAKSPANAAAAYQKANTLLPSGKAMAGRYRALVMDGKTAQADSEAGKWLANNPKDIALRAYLAEQALQSKDYAKAAGQYEAIVSMQPQNPMFLNNLAYCYQQIKSPKARATAEAALKLAPDNPAIMDTLGAILLEGGMSQQGLMYLQRAAEVDKSNREIRLHLAQAYLKAGQVAKAKQELEKLAVYGDQSDIAVTARKLLGSL